MATLVARLKSRLSQIELFFMRAFFNKVARFLRAADGPTAVEYATLLALILLICLTAVTLVGQNTSTSITNSKNSLISATK